MPTTIAQQILDHVETHLGTIPGVTVWGNRTEEVDKFPALVVVEGEDKPDNDNTGVTLITMSVGIEGHVQATTDAELRAAREALYAAALAKLLADTTQGGRAIDTNHTGTERWTDQGEGHKPTAGFSAALEILFATVEGDPFTQAGI